LGLGKPDQKVRFVNLEDESKFTILP
jgi:hypothetical protein